MNELYYINFNTLEELQSNLKDAKNGIDLSYFVTPREVLQLTDDGVGIIDVRGALTLSAPQIMSDLGNTSYDTIESEINKAIAQGAKSLLFKVNSGGGGVKGNAEIADLISNLPIPTVAHGTSLMCSAAYKIAVSCDIVAATPSCDCGNVGTILAYTDASKMYAAAGIEHKAIVSEGATLKSTFHLASLTEEQEEFLQSQINTAGEKFVDHVKANRPNIDADAFRAGWYCGTEALTMGIIDGVGSLDDAYQTAISLQHQLGTL